MTEAGRFKTPVCSDEAAVYQCWNLNAIETRIRELLSASAASTPIDSVGVDGWGVDFVLLNQSFNQVGKAVCYRDKRTTGVMQQLRSQITDEVIYGRTGIQFLPFNTLYQLAAVAAQEPAWIDEARHLLMIPDYLHFRLCGVSSNEYTNATTTQLLNIDGNWDTFLLEAAGLKRTLIAPPIPAASILGTMYLGSTSAKVIAPATHDTASAIAGTPLEGPDEAYISSGTWSLMGIESHTPIATPAAMRMNFTNEGGLEQRFRILKNITGMWPLQRLCEEHGIDGLHSLAAELESAPPWRSILYPDDPAFLNPPRMDHAIREYCVDTNQPAPDTLLRLVRCVLSSLALSYRKVKDELELLRGHPLSRIRIIGGGCQNRLLNQLCADACQLPVSAGPAEASALGNLCAQWIALGAIDNLNAARALIRASFPCEEYTPKSAIPNDVWDRFRQLSHTNSTR
jgi:rhamnulokinase